MMATFMNIRVWGATALMCFASASASAAAIQLTYQSNLTDPTGQITGTGTIRAGEMHFATSGDTMYWDEGLGAFCIQTNTSLAGTASYAIQSGLGAFGATQQAQIGGLFSSYYQTSTTSAHNSAAFQLALWEIVNESTLPGPLSLVSGSFESTSFDGARTIADSWLAELGSDTGEYAFYIFRSDESQDLLTAIRQVPEPATLTLLGAGLLAFAIVRRRRVESQRRVRA